MSAAEYLERMKSCASFDEEGAHMTADAILVEIIRRFLPEFDDVCNEYARLGKWYA